MFVVWCRYDDTNWRSTPELGRGIVERYAVHYIINVSLTRACNLVTEMNLTILITNVYHRRER